LIIPQIISLILLIVIEVAYLLIYISHSIVLISITHSIMLSLMHVLIIVGSLMMMI